MENIEEIDQFELLEGKIDSLVSYVSSLKNERESLVEKINIQEERIADLSRDVELLKATKDKARQRIVTLLEKIDQLDI